ncbi:MAG: penicillin-binding protein 2 [Thermoleophilia bacterium]|nr:penicillin-binding protein 2 [Thermoleophilia bacterium]
MAVTTRERPRARARPRPQPGVLAPGAVRWRPPPELSLRIAILAGIVLVAFAALFLRLWALQVLSEAQYADAARNNQLRTLRVPAPRGPIVDRNGRVLVTNTVGSSVQVWPSDLPDGREARRFLLRRLARVVGVPAADIERALAEHTGGPATPVTIKYDAPRDVVTFLSERQTEFPGVVVARSYVRSYPHGSLAAHVLGHVGEVTRRQLERRPDLRAGDEAGQGGIEAAYDAFLRGRPGAARLRVDSLGRARSQLFVAAQPHPGHALRLTLDLELQRAAEHAVDYGIELARGSDCIGCWSSNAGAVVALDPRTGEVLALASRPTYQPRIFAGRVRPRALAAAGLTADHAPEANFPAVNRATAGLYPPGSTFKPVTALAALHEGLLGYADSLPCTPIYKRFQQEFKNWDPYVYTAMTLPTALAASCDTFFYELGYRFYKLPPDRGSPLQEWARRLGFGERTGIDIGSEEAGLLPTPAWRKESFDTELDRAWKPGDSIQLAIGQKDLLVTPLQMTRFYALIANGGRLVTPHVAADVEQPRRNGAEPSVLRRFLPPAPRTVGVDPNALAIVRDGLVLATHESFGTSTAVFGAYPVQIAGKTGTAEKAVDGVLQDQSWWCGYAPADARPTIVVCAVIENGGHGGTAAAPAAMKVFEAYFGHPAPPFVPRETD